MKRYVGYFVCVLIAMGIVFSVYGGGGGGGGGGITPGSLDTTFGTNGKVITDIGGREDEAHALAIQSDGKIVVAGESWNGKDYDFAVVRYNPDGSLDTTFGTNGKVRTDIGGRGNAAYALAIQKDGKIVVAGFSDNGANLDFAIVRYNPDGSLDTTFGTGGIVTTPVGTGGDVAHALVIQKDGKIVVAGDSRNGTDEDFAVVRYNPDGSLDTTFGTGGIVTTDIGGRDRAFALAIQSDGKIVVAGFSDNGANLDFAIVRYNADGTLDTTFGRGGIVTTPVGTGDDVAYAIAIQKDGKIVVAGDSANAVTNYDFAVVRYNANGSLDTTFGRGGKVRTDIGTGTVDYAYALAIQPDGKIVVAGYSGGHLAMVRYNANGSLDTTFGRGGIVTTDIGDWDEAYALAIQPDGKIVVAGYSGGHLAMVRYNADGSLDTTFGGGDGIVTTDIGSLEDIAYALAIQPDGKIVVAGYSLNAGTNTDFAVVRYNPDGSLDTTFGRNGKVKTDIGGRSDVAYAIAIQKDGKIVVAGYSWNVNTKKDFAVVRYNPDGSLDTTFGTGGIVTTDIGTNSDNGATAVAIQKDGKIVVAGYSYNGKDDDFAIVRYWP